MIAYLPPALLAAALAAFALANPQPVAVTFWPEGWVAELPLWQATTCRSMVWCWSIRVAVCTGHQKGACLVIYSDAVGLIKVAI